MAEQHERHSSSTRDAKRAFIDKAHRPRGGGDCRPQCGGISEVVENRIPGPRCYICPLGLADCEIDLVAPDGTILVTCLGKVTPLPSC